MEKNRKNLKRLISSEYGTLKECAEMLGIKPNNLAQKMDRITDSFLEDLASIGVAIPENWLNNYTNAPDSAGKSEKIKEPNLDYKITAEYLSPQIIKLQNEVDELKKQNQEILKRMDAKDEMFLTIIKQQRETLAKLGVEIPILAKIEKSMKKDSK